MRVIPNFIDPDAYPAPTPEHRAAMRARLQLPSDALVIGSVADITSGKRPSDLVSAAGPLLATGARLLIAGAELDEAEAARVRTAAQGLNVLLLGRRGDVPELLAAFDIFALASEREEMPVAVLEAMAAGLPVVAAETGGLAEMVAEGQTGFLVPPRDVAAFGQRLRQLADDPDLRSRMGAASRRRAVTEYGREAIAPRIEAVLEEAARLRPGWAD